MTLEDRINNDLANAERYRKAKEYDALRDALTETRDALFALMGVTKAYRTRKIAEAYAKAASAVAKANKAIAHAEPPRTRRDVYSGGLITCRAMQEIEGNWRDGPAECGGNLWYEWPRTLDAFNYECARCGNHVYPMTETGASR